MKSKRGSRNGLRRKNSQPNRPQPTTPITIASATVAGSVLTIEFNQPVSLTGVPQYTTDVAGADPVSAVKSNATTVEITFDAAVAAATVVNIPYEEPGVRNSSGGFVSNSTFPV
jgi:hypothetical protein